MKKQRTHAGNSAKSAKVKAELKSYVDKRITLSEGKLDGRIVGKVWYTKPLNTSHLEGFIHGLITAACVVILSYAIGAVWLLMK